MKDSALYLPNMPLAHTRSDVLYLKIRTSQDSIQEVRKIMSEKEHVKEEIVELLNELLETDRAAIAALTANRVPCNQKIADHPTVQVASQNDGYTLGMIGLLNGICDGRLMAEFEEDPNQPLGFKKLVRFSLAPAK